MQRHVFREFVEIIDQLSLQYFFPKIYCKKSRMITFTCLLKAPNFTGGWDQ